MCGNILEAINYHYIIHNLLAWKFILQVLMQDEQPRLLMKGEKPRSTAHDRGHILDDCMTWMERADKSAK